MDSVRMTDAQSAAVQKTPNRVSLDDIERNIAQEFSFRAEAAFDAVCDRDAGPHPALGLLTIHVIVLANGFTVIGKTAPADAANFDADLGRKFAREDAIRQIWPLMGYALRERLQFRETLLADSVKRRTDLFGEGPGAGVEQDVAAGERKTGITDLPKDQQEQLDEGKPIEPRPDPGSRPVDTPPPAPAAAPPADTPMRDQVLIGSDKFDAHVDIGGVPVQLGELVAGAQQRSGISVHAWNELGQPFRDALIEGEIRFQRACVAGGAAADAAQGDAARPVDADGGRGSTGDVAQVTAGPQS
jgi:hypothetical protein